MDAESPVRSLPSIPEPSLIACIHEAAHAVVDRSFGLPVSAVWVTGEEGMVEAPQTPPPEFPSASHCWASLCSIVAGDLAELLWHEVNERGDTGDWPSDAERQQYVCDSEAILRAWGGKSTGVYEFPDGELGGSMRYAIALTGRVVTLTARLWWAIKRYGGTAADVSPIPSDCTQALRYASRVLAAGPAVQPFAQPWPTDEVDGGGLFKGFHVIRYAEVEAERLLKREWAGVCAVARSLYRRRNHRLTGRQLDAVLRRYGTVFGSDSPPVAPSD